MEIQIIREELTSVKLYHARTRNCPNAGIARINFPNHEIAPKACIKSVTSITLCFGCTNQSMSFMEKEFHDRLVTSNLRECCNLRVPILKSLRTEEKSHRTVETSHLPIYKAVSYTHLTLPTIYSV